MICLTVIIINLTPSWNIEDTKVLNRAKIVCKTRYKLCLKKAN